MLKFMYPIIGLLLLIQTIRTVSFDVTQIDKHGVPLNQAKCNKDTVVDFNFSPDSMIANCTSAGCQVVSPDQSTLRFLNVAGQQETYTLQNATIVLVPGGISTPNEKAAFLYTFVNINQQVLVAIPFSNAQSSNLTLQAQQLNVQSSTDPSLSFLSTVTTQGNNATGIPLSAFNYLNKMDFGHFYHVADDTTTVTYLLGYFALSNVQIPLTNLPTLVTPFPPSTVDYGKTGDLLCYGSASEGLFQTHLRQSWPLWTFWVAIFLYWIYYLTTDLITLNCFDKRFQNNKWTCWSFYSLHFLGHEEFFTKLLRQTMMLITFIWQALILSVLYSQIPYNQHNVEIFWIAASATFTSLPFPYVLGYFFHSKIYAKTLHKFEVMKRREGHFNKKDPTFEACQKQLDDIEEQLYGLYYWFYVITFVFFVAFSVISVRQMMQIPREYYYLMRCWLASLGVAFGLEHLVLEPLLTLCFGNFRFFRMKGFYYDFRLGQSFRELEQ